MVKEVWKTMQLFYMKWDCLLTFAAGNCRGTSWPRPILSQQFPHTKVCISGVKRPSNILPKFKS